MKNLCTLCLILTVLLGCPLAFAHPGRLDRYGGHYEVTREKGKTVRRYHFHNGSLQGKQFASLREALQARRDYEEKERAKKEKEKKGPEEQRTVEMKVIKVYQPDVIKVAAGNVSKLARLLGVKRPTSLEKRARVTERLKLLVEGRNVEFEFANPPVEGNYYRGFVWIEVTDKDHKTRREMVNIMLLRDGDCEADIEETAPHTADFKKALGTEALRPRVLVTHVYSPVTFYIKGRKLARLAGLTPVTTPEIHKEAQAFVQDLIQNKEVQYENCKPERDSTGALLLYVWLGKDKKDMLNIMMIDKGYATPDTRLYHPYAADFQKALDACNKRTEELQRLAEQEKARQPQQKPVKTGKEAPTPTEKPKPADTKKDKPKDMEVLE